MSSQLRPPKPVKLIVGLLSQSEDLLAMAEDDMEKLWGKIDVRSEVMPFNYTKYYKKSMGESILRKFVSFAEIIDPAKLASIKHQSNDLEEKYTQVPAGIELGVERPVNLDPGYITPGKLVLASTKDYSHRIYIGEDMYAEPTLHFYKGTWHPWPFSYPDYGSGDYFEFLTASRDCLMEQLLSL